MQGDNNHTENIKSIHNPWHRSWQDASCNVEDVRPAVATCEIGGHLTVSGGKGSIKFPDPYVFL
jgi:hypothetical protein